MQAGASQPNYQAKPFTYACAVIDSVLSRNKEWEREIGEQCNSVAATDSIQAASEWALSFEKLYEKVKKYPHLRSDLDAKIKALSASDGLESAMDWWRHFELKYLRLGGTLLTVESNDRTLKDTAESLAMKSERAIMDELGKIKVRGATGKYCMMQAKHIARAICSGVGVEVPGAGEVLEEKEEIAAIMARLCCAKWWRRSLRVLQARKLETAAREMGLVCKRRGGYCSMPTLRRRAAQKVRNRELLEALTAENNVGQVFTLAELAKRGVSNPEKRRAELMTRIHGFEEWAKRNEGWTPAFITQTAPSRYHSHNKYGIRNPKWDGSTPREAQDYMNSVWKKVRPAIDRAGIPFFGIRVVEPHHDGCPHWHALVWFPSHQVEKALAIWEGYALQDAPPPKGKEGVRFKAKLDEVASGATGYIAKYISKNVDGLTSEGKAWDPNVLKTAIRTEAWASTWGIRQFQQLGGASVTVWREVRRLRDEQIAEAPELDAIREAANQGDWCGYTVAMGGAVLRRADRPLRAFMVRKRSEAGELVKNAYGEFMRKLSGLMAFGWLPIKTRIYEWVIRPVKKGVESFQEAHAPPLDLCQ